MSLSRPCWDLKIKKGSLKYNTNLTCSPLKRPLVLVESTIVFICRRWERTDRSDEAARKAPTAVGDTCQPIFLSWLGFFRGQKQPQISSVMPFNSCVKVPLNHLRLFLVCSWIYFIFTIWCFTSMCTSPRSCWRATFQLSSALLKVSEVGFLLYKPGYSFLSLNYFWVCEVLAG